MRANVFLDSSDKIWFIFLKRWKIPFLIIIFMRELKGSQNKFSGKQGFIYDRRPESRKSD